MIDHVILTVSDMDRSIEFYNQALKPLGLSHLIDFDGSTGPEGHPDLKGFGKDHTYPLWLRAGVSAGRAAHVGFTAPSKEAVNAAYTAAMAAGATDNGAPSDRLYYGPGYYAATVLDPDRYSLEFTYKEWLHPTGSRIDHE
ncbi:VOC family protein [Fodinicola feengrottensis]|uniref:VOC family protein n=1 Tax=Fodinicola feengrottensis TaxID=435914 RepID=A0ABN2IM10_9ACTN